MTVHHRAEVERLGAGDRRLGQEHWATLEAVAARIIPSDEYAGAQEAGTSWYVVSRAHDDAAAWAGLIDGLIALDTHARRRHGVAFAEAGPDVQDELLAMLERDADPFFGQLLVTVMEGFYGDPRHGGNRDAVSWQMIGFPGPDRAGGWERPLGWYDEHVPDEESV